MSYQPHQSEAHDRLVKAAQAAYEHRYQSGAPMLGIYDELKSAADAASLLSALGAEGQPIPSVYPTHAAESSATVPPQAPAWMAIETAPKDGTHVLIANDSPGSVHPREGYYAAPEHRYDNEPKHAGWWRLAGSSEEMVHGRTPTHWMPLPAPPGATKEAQAPEGLAVPVALEYRHCDAQRGWGAWERVLPRNQFTDTVEDRVREIQAYIERGYKYELRALYASPVSPAQPVRMPTDAELVQWARSYDITGDEDFDAFVVRKAFEVNGLSIGPAPAKDEK